MLEVEACAGAGRTVAIKASEGGILIFEAEPYEPERPAPARDEIERALTELVEGCQVSGG